MRAKSRSGKRGAGSGKKVKGANREIRVPRKSAPKAIGGVSDLVLDPGNVNRGTERGRAMLAASVEQYGVGRGVVVDRNGVIIAGNATVAELRARGTQGTQETKETQGTKGANRERPAGQFGGRVPRVVVVPSDGDVLVVTQRTDLDLTAPDGKARGLAIADNRVSETNYAADAALLLGSIERRTDMEPFYDAASIALLMGTKVGPDAPKKTVSFTAGSGKKVKCPGCAREFLVKGNEVQGKVGSA